MNKKILFIQPTPYDMNKNLIKKKKLYFVGLAFPLLAALTPPDWEVEVCLETIEDVPYKTDADVIAIGSMGHAVIRSMDIAKKFKKRGKTVLLGGYMVSLMPEEAKKCCDSIVIGDAEGVWHEVLKDIEDNNLKPFYQKELTELNCPTPKYELLLNKNIGDFLPVQAGRGCPNVCSFCSVYCLYKTKYYRSPIENVIRDIKRVKELGFKKFLLLDDNILSDKDYLKKLCTEIKKLDMSWLSQCSVEIGRDGEILEIVRDSGCIALSFGIESISQESLNSMNKAWAKVEEYGKLLENIRKAGIDVSTEMVVGAEGDTVESIMATAKFIEDNKIVVPRFYILTPIPGTEFFSKMKEQNRIINHDIYSYNGTEAVHQPRNMSPDELTQSYWKLYNKVFSIKSILNRTIFHGNFFKRPLNFLFYLGVNLFYRSQIKNKITPNII
ncbi:tRNA-2-methylthio-N(6)-dimethylallyladenosine synthase [Oxobacter pfennigii]|uniref:tRNA-2-methylthio-N(6)-dimethylallyladenosine synthase n=1 Tax=Oxobacter pfennigii TaxID=36849 RepID=A0A0P9AH89_9CLOT|nr:radical SAM protein [Oxobacter pfennigii]KPU44823.1 tRNA-2-methylthio-N(6)-dimethylallyladenosine synthase [Oxobacter pfennigii]